jgi:hypothetical protein
MQLSCAPYLSPAKKTAQILALRNAGRAHQKNQPERVGVGRRKKTAVAYNKMSSLGCSERMLGSSKPSVHHFFSSILSFSTSKIMNNPG